MEKYIFTSERLGFRNWTEEDLPEFTKINADVEVMEYFPKLLTESETYTFIKRVQTDYKKHGYNYFACEIIETGEFIGFIGLAYQDFEAIFTPTVDIGWRLKQSAWGKGYASEGAKRCLEFAFNDLNLERIISTCTLQNNKSEHVMKKIGMKKKTTFNHPKLKAYPAYEKCVMYEIRKNDFISN